MAEDVILITAEQEQQVIAVSLTTEAAAEAAIEAATKAALEAFK